MKSKKTYFAPPDREEKQVLLKKSKRIRELPYTTKILNTFPNFVLVVNKHRQVIFANEAFQKMFGIRKFEEVLGLRPGELIKCVHAHDTENGCGTGRACKYCGAVLTVLKSQETGLPQTGEARITTEVEEEIIQLDLHIHANPIEVDSIHYTVVYMNDISNLKRREYLERTFIHDIINSTWALSNRLDFFPQDGFDQTQSIHFNKIKIEINRILDDIESQRDIIKLENRELTINYDTINTLVIIKSSIETISTDESANNKIILIDISSVSKDITSDKRLIRRVLINLLKNALEASTEKEEIVIGSKEIDGNICFWVKNSAVMSEEVKSQVFQRFFSTKGPGRGLGTYSVKILVEEYLNGKVTFESTKEKGTIFKVILNQTS
ncbi:MAG: PAS domain-containing protein [Asgard group archaeon]|nr:PAS domain-containing protein [Asgard group archaeon]